MIIDNLECPEADPLLYLGNFENDLCKVGVESKESGVGPTHRKRFTPGGQRNCRAEGGSLGGGRSKVTLGNDFWQRFTRNGAVEGVLFPKNSLRKRADCR